jgi:hypothetical protein
LAHLLPSLRFLNYVPVLHARLLEEQIFWMRHNYF